MAAALEARGLRRVHESGTFAWKSPATLLADVLLLLATCCIRRKLRLHSGQRWKSGTSVHRRELRGPFALERAQRGTGSLNNALEAVVGRCLRRVPVGATGSKVRNVLEVGVWSCVRATSLHVELKCRPCEPEQCSSRHCGRARAGHFATSRCSMTSAHPGSHATPEEDR